MDDKETRSYILENLVDQYTMPMKGDTLICKSHIKVFSLVTKAGNKKLISKNDVGLMLRQQNTRSVKSEQCDLCNKNDITAEKVIQGFQFPLISTRE